MVDMIEKLEEKFGTNPRIADELGIPYRTWMDWRALLVNEDEKKSRKETQVKLILSYIERALSEAAGRAAAN